MLYFGCPSQFSVSLSAMILNWSADQHDGDLFALVTVGTFVMAPAGLGDLAQLCGPLHRGADLAQ